MEKEKTEIIKNMKKQVFFHLPEFYNSFFVFEKISYSLPMWLVTTVLFVPVGKRSNSRPLMFCKIDALKNLATIISQENTCDGDSF